jgi:hypothetical protein
MTLAERRRYRAGDSLEDLCRACKLVRRHTVVVASDDGRPGRVICDYCGSQHNYRGGNRAARPSRASGAAPRARSTAPGGAFDFVTERERSAPPMNDLSNEGSGQDLELLLRRIIREEAGLTPATPADKWRGGELVLKAGREGVQDKSWPIETFFHKIVMVRNRLRVLEQQINGAELPQDLKIKLQSYITASYGSLTSLNVLFADDEDRFKGSGGADG